MEFLSRLLDTGDFPARWTCGNWTPGHGWLHIVGDSLIFLAYLSIPLSLALLLRRRRDFPYPYLLLLFSAFIFFCGVGHLMEAIIFWHPIYRLAGLWKAGTASVSLVTAIVLIRAMPGALALPSVARANAELRASLAREQSLTAELTAARDELERNTSKVTGRVWRLNRAISSAGVVACRWTLPDARVEWEIGFDESARAAGLAPGVALGHWSDLLDADTLRNAVRAWERGAEASSSVDLELPARSGRWHGRVRISASPEPRVQGESPVMIGMFRLLDESAD